MEKLTNTTRFFFHASACIERGIKCKYIREHLLDLREGYLAKLEQRTSTPSILDIFSFLRIVKNDGEKIVFLCH